MTFILGRVVRRVMLVGVGACISLSATHLARSQAELAVPKQESKERALVVLSKDLPKLNGNHLKLTLVEVNYGPGEASAPHSHPCAVIGYVATGTLRTQVKGEPEMIYKAGGSFYEAPNGIHLISANASTTEPAKLLAYFVCDQDAPLSVDVVGANPLKGPTQ